MATSSRHVKRRTELEKLEAVHLYVRSETFDRDPFHELVRLVNSHMMIAELSTLETVRNNGSIDISEPWKVLVYLCAYARASDGERRGKGDDVRHGRAPSSSIGGSPRSKERV